MFLALSLGWGSMIFGSGVSLGAVLLGPNLIQNGDFEDTTATETELNNLNGQFSELLPGVTGFGARSGLDLMTVGAGFGRPQSGQWKVTAAADGSGASEAFTFALSTPAILGERYVLSFYTERMVQPPFDGGVVEIGLSNSSDSFGTLVFVSSPATDGWSEESATIVAPLDAEFLSVRLDGSADSWVGLDNFRLTLVPEPSGAGLGAIGGLVFALRRRRTLR